MATCKNCGKPLILNGGKCLYCGAAVNAESKQVLAGQQVKGKSKPIVQRRSNVNRPKTIEQLSIKVTSPGCDDMGKILERLGIRYTSFNGDFDCDILFLNCLTGDPIDPEKLNSFVQNGGILYASDLTDRHVSAAWPVLMSVDYGNSVCTIRAKVVDTDLRQYLGRTIDITFDMGSWAKIIEAPTGKVLMKSADEGFPIMLEFAIGQGKVFYTSFHNHAQTDDAEEKLLKLLVIKQVSAATKQSFQQTVQSLSSSL